MTRKATLKKDLLTELIRWKTIIKINYNSKKKSVCGWKKGKKGGGEATFLTALCMGSFLNWNGWTVVFSGNFRKLSSVYEVCRRTFSNKLMHTTILFLRLHSGTESDECFLCVANLIAQNMNLKKNAHIPVPFNHDLHTCLAGTIFDVSMTWGRLMWMEVDLSRYSKLSIKMSKLSGRPTGWCS